MRSYEAGSLRLQTCRLLSAASAACAVPGPCQSECRLLKEGSVQIVLRGLQKFPKHSEAIFLIFTDPSRARIPGTV